VLRPGGTPVEKIEVLLGRKVERAPASPEASLLATESPQVAPGMLESHYAPRKPLILLPAALDALSGEQVREQAPRLRPGTPVGLLAFRGVAEKSKALLEALFGVEVSQVRVLTASGDTREAARNLFSALRELDGSAAQILIAEPCPADSALDTGGLSHAIQDRLKRASAPR
jgi:L-threonylcarbamoyladenylate synthase